MDKINRMFRLEKTTHRLLFWMIVIVIFSATVLLALYQIVDRQARLDVERTRLVQSLENQKILLENWGITRMNEVTYMAEQEVTKMKNYEAMSDLFQYHVEHLSEVDAFVFLDEEGHVIVDSRREQPLTHSGASLRDRDYFIAAQAGEKYVSDNVVGEGNDHPAVIFSSPVETIDQKFGGVVYGQISLSTMSDLLQHTALGESGNVLLVDQEGNVLFGPQQKEQGVDIQTDIFKSALAGEDQVASYKNASGELVIGEYLSLFDDRFFLIDEIEVAEVLEPHKELGRIILIVSSAIALIGMLFIFLIIRSNLQSLTYFTEAIQHVSKGNYEYEIDEKMYKRSPREIQAMMDVFQEMTKQINQNKQELVRLTEIDELTGAYNRRTFTSALKSEWELAYKQSTPLSIAFIDIDLFKLFNDAFGHLVGDEVLIRIAESIDRALIGTGGKLYRYGGEEFVVLFPNTHKIDAFSYAESIRQMIEKEDIYHEDGSRVTISIGLTSVVPLSLDGAVDFLRRADEALYKAKESGRNQVVATDIDHKQ